MNAFRLRRWAAASVALATIGTMLGLSACTSDDPILATDDTTACADTLSPRFSIEVRAVFQRNCIECHASSIATAGVVLDSYDGVKVRVDNGQLLSAVRQDGTVRPMPFGRPRIPLCELRIIEKWVAAGAPNN